VERENLRWKALCLWDLEDSWQGRREGRNFRIERRLIVRAIIGLAFWEIDIADLSSRGKEGGRERRSVALNSFD
jgi:hypothetical protein